ncbi:MAG: N-acetylmuramoyl-L-alanine amidase [Armatimonadetes bacterium]|nr:N-acetylmuramoyl-L-alanine amidase [Armatimonadota bacterium]
MNNISRLRLRAFLVLMITVGLLLAHCARKPSTSVTLYFSDSNGRLLLPVSRQIPQAQNLPANAITELLRGPKSGGGLLRLLPPETRLLDLKVEKGLAVVSFSKELERGFEGGSTAESLMIRSVVWTLTEFPEISRVAFQVEGKPLTVLRQGHEDLDEEPYDREPHINIIYPERTTKNTSPVVFYFPARGTRFLAPLSLQLDKRTANLRGIAQFLFGDSPLPQLLDRVAPPGVSVTRVEQSGGEAIVSLAAGSVEALRRMPSDQDLPIRALLMTLTEQPGIGRIVVKEEGGSPGKLGDLDLSTPLMRPSLVNKESAFTTDQGAAFASPLPRIAVAGQEVSLARDLVESGDTIHIPAQDPGTQRILSTFDASLSWDESSLRLYFSLPRKRYVLGIDSRQGTMNGSPVEIPVAPLLLNGHPYIPLETLAFLLDARVRKERGGQILNIYPTIRRIQYVSEEGKRKVVIGASAPVSYTTFMLKDPPYRVVVDVPGTSLGIAEKRIPVQDGFIDEIHVDQFKREPDVTRIVVVFAQEGGVEFPPRLNTKEIVMELKGDPASGAAPDPVETPAETPSYRHITAVNVEEAKDGVQVTIEGDGAISYEWHRLKAPDCRIFIDIPNALLDFPKKAVPQESSLLSEMRVAQFQKDPYPVVRIVLDLRDSFDFTVKTSSNGVHKILATILPGRVDPLIAVGQGKGSTGPMNAGFSDRNKVIVLDPGHGGSDTGCICRQTGTLEKDLTLDIAFRVRKLLQTRLKGWKVVMTRETDRDVTYAGSPAKEELQARVDVGLETSAYAFISLHINASTSAAPNGVSTHWYKENDVALAQAIQRNVGSDLGLADKGLMRNRFYVVRHSPMPAVLVEMGFLTNGRDKARLLSSDFRQRLAQAVSDGIVEYVKEGAE